MLKGGLGNLMKQAQNMQENMQKMQEKLALVEVEGQAGAGMVKVAMTCRHDVKRVTIDDSLMNPDEKNIVEDLVTAAFNDARDKADRVSADQMKEMQGSMGLPPGFNLPGLG